MATGMMKGQRFMCQNSECGCELEVNKAVGSSQTEYNPRHSFAKITNSVPARPARNRPAHRSRQVPIRPSS
jgi:hypothetical protein